MELKILSDLIPIEDQPFEVVEIKGRGHPDTICDLLCERISSDLFKVYQDEFGKPLHYNIDKAFLVGGKSQPKFGGGKILQPIKLYLGDRAETSYDGKSINLQKVIEDSAKSWLAENLRHLRLGEELQLINEIKTSSATLNSVEDRRVSNDTSVGIGSWPPTKLEQILLDLEAHLNSPDFKSRHPYTGEDIKIMASRSGKTIDLVFAIAVIDRFISSTEDYREKKNILKQAIQDRLQEFKTDFKFNISINCLDEYDRGEDGLYLTVIGLSCESGDSGQVGRGNRVNGLISFLRPQTLEAWAGKNPISHVGKIYSFAAQNLARKIFETFNEVRSADVFMVGEIGKSISTPSHLFCRLSSKSNKDIETFIHKQLRNGDIFKVRNLVRNPL